MKLYNPTPERIIGACRGVSYLVENGHYINVSEETGAWILERWAFVGIVDITPKDKNDLQKLVIIKSLEGLEKYIQHCNDVLESFVQLDTEMKAINIYGTVLKDKNVKRVTNNMNIAIRMSEELENKYGVSIRKSEEKEKVNSLLSSIDSLIQEVEADQQKDTLERQRDVDLDNMLKKVIPKNVLQRSKEASI